jgi:hypothetical protein
MIRATHADYAWYASLLVTLALLAAVSTGWPAG